MTKEEFAARLRARGYEAENEKGCVIVLSDHDIMAELRDIAKAEEYSGSYGWRLKQ